MTPTRVIGTSVYPRWRGEHRQVAKVHKSRRGLSPLARGTPAEGNAQDYFIRFIPAGAGNTEDTLNEYLVIPVYPRWRGEHCPGAWSILFFAGLSPLARGTLQTIQIIQPLPRFIPAGAGNTQLPGREKGPRTVYPRWRGEHSKTISLI